MSETSPARHRLLSVGLNLAQTLGIRGIVIRELAKSAGVNLGSFVYHFGTRDKFIEELVELWYTPILTQLHDTTESPNIGNALERLQTGIDQLLDFGEENASFVWHLVADAFAGESAARNFLLRIPERHPKMLIKLVEDAQREGFLIEESPLHLFTYLMAATGLPMVIACGPLKQLDWLIELDGPIFKAIEDKNLAHKRLAWALQGIRTYP